MEIKGFFYFESSYYVLVDLINLQIVASSAYHFITYIIYV